MPTHSLHAAWALLPQGFASNVRLEIAQGQITAITPNAPAAATDERLGVVVPGIGDLHSHAFQRVFAGATHHIAGGTDFWSWREAMYRAATVMTPDLYTPVMAWLCKELLKGGYTALAEFHYLHHRADGAPYAPATAMAQALAEGAAAAGLPLTVLLTVYERGGFDGRALAGGQHRFAMALDQAAAMAASLQPHVATGLALHSLRAATPATVQRAATMFPAGPIHIHAAEQTAEVADCTAALGAPPIAWLLDHAPVDRRWCLVHATHATAPEITAAAKRGAVTGLCPTTEADLGDGIYDFVTLQAQQGAWGIGSDSNTCLDACAELRLLEYGQRLVRRARTIAATPATPTGRALWQAAAAGGAQACGRGAGALAEGAAADLVVLAETPEAAGKSPDRVLDSAIFAATGAAARHVMAAGNWQIREFRHIHEDRLNAAYGAALKALA